MAWGTVAALSQDAAMPLAEPIITFEDQRRQLLERYDGNVPRYTSYPTAVEFSNAVDEDVTAVRGRANPRGGFPLGTKLVVSRAHISRAYRRRSIPPKITPSDSYTARQIGLFLPRPGARELDRSHPGRPFSAWSRLAVAVRIS